MGATPSSRVAFHSFRSVCDATSLRWRSVTLANDTGGEAWRETFKATPDWTPA